MKEEKPFPIDVTLRNALPGYKNAYFEFTDLDTKEVKVVGFMISPNSFSEARSNNANLVRTKSGWFSARMGRNPVNLSLTGYMLDTKECQERHNFIQNFYKEYIEDKKNRVRRSLQQIRSIFDNRRKEIYRDFKFAECAKISYSAIFISILHGVYGLV